MRLLNALLIGFVGALYGSAFYLPFSLVLGAINHTDPAAVWTNFWQGAIVAFLFISIAAYEMIGISDERNRQARERLEKEEADKQLQDPRS